MVIVALQHPFIVQDRKIADIVLDTIATTHISSFWKARKAYRSANFCVLMWLLGPRLDLDHIDRIPSHLPHSPFFFTFVMVKIHIFLISCLVVFVCFFNFPVVLKKKNGDFIRTRRMGISDCRIELQLKWNYKSRPMLIFIFFKKYLKWLYNCNYVLVKKKSTVYIYIYIHTLF
jgi:hypothetical protein